MLVTTVFVYYTVENARCKRAFDIVMLVNYFELIVLGAAECMCPSPHVCIADLLILAVAFLFC